MALVYQHDKQLKFRSLEIILIFSVFIILVFSEILLIFSVLDKLMLDLSGEFKTRLTDFCKVVGSANVIYF